MELLFRSQREALHKLLSHPVQRAALGQSQDLVKSLPESSTGWLATNAVQPGKEKFALGTFEKK